MVGLSCIFKFQIVEITPTLGTEYNQLAILNDDFTLNMEKLEQQVFFDPVYVFGIRMIHFTSQGLPWYAASQLLFKVSRTLYIGGKCFGTRQTKHRKLTGEITPAAVTHFFLWHSRTVYNIIWDSRVSFLAISVVSTC